MSGGDDEAAGSGAIVPLSVAEVQARIDRVPFSTFLGLRAAVIEPERVVLTAAAKDGLMGNPEVGAIHGGVLAAMIDTACSYVLIAATRRGVVTVDLRVDFHRPAFGAAFTVEARPVNVGRTLAVMEADVRDAAGKLIASGRAALMRLRD